MASIAISHLTIACGQLGKRSGELYYLYDSSWNHTVKEKASYLVVEQHPDDTTFQIKTYQYTGPLIAIETYRDKEQKIPHGYFAWFDKNGLLDSSGYSYEGRKDREWLYFTDELKVWQSEKYERGKLINSKDSVQLRLEREGRDTAAFLPVDKEAAYPGGDKAWLSYIMKKLELPQRTSELHKKGTILAVFVVNTEGIITDIHLRRSVEFMADEEVIRFLSNAPKWIPASQNGHPVKAYRVQPISFNFQ